MTFTDRQIRNLRAKLDSKHVRTRKANGADLSYIEGWLVIAEANRIFGFDAWDRRTLSTHCVWTGKAGDHHIAAYTATVRICVRAGDVPVIREGTGAGEGKASTPGQAHEFALKQAETDATKRALATFGNRFGLALYDKEMSGVSKPVQRASRTPELEEWRLRTNGTDRPYASPESFAEALREALSTASSMEGLFDLWEHNVDTVKALNRAGDNSKSPKSVIAKSLVAHFKARAVALADGGSLAAGSPSSPNGGTPALAHGSGVDKSRLAIPEPRRVRCKAHLSYVAKQPCLLCGRRPAQAHHIRFAQPRALARKVSDEFTVPVCAIHHGDLHKAGDEASWWRQKGIDPLAVAVELWKSDPNASPEPSIDSG